MASLRAVQAFANSENIPSTPHPAGKGGAALAPTTARRALGDITNFGKGDNAPTTAKRAAGTAAPPPTNPFAERSAAKAKTAAAMLFPPSSDLDVEYMPAPLPAAKFDPHYELDCDLASVEPFPPMNPFPRLRYPVDQPLPPLDCELEPVEERPADADAA